MEGLGRKPTLLGLLLMSSLELGPKCRLLGRFGSFQRVLEVDRVYTASSLNYDLFPVPKIIRQPYKKDPERDLSYPSLHNYPRDLG